MFVALFVCMVCVAAVWVAVFVHRVCSTVKAEADGCTGCMQPQQHACCPAMHVPQSFSRLLLLLLNPQISKLLFVDLPGAERLGMDAEVLRLREGLSLNKSLLGLGLVLRRLAQVGSVCTFSFL